MSKMTPQLDSGFKHFTHPEKEKAPPFSGSNGTTVLDVIPPPETAPLLPNVISSDSRSIGDGTDRGTIVVV